MTGCGHRVKTTVVTDFNEFGCFRGLEEGYGRGDVYLSHGLALLCTQLFSNPRDQMIEDCYKGILPDRMFPIPSGTGIFFPLIRHLNPQEAFRE
jgi:hypothetical protein